MTEPHETGKRTEARELVVGIDFGTTNSEIAVFEEGQPQILGEPLILPSVVGIDERGQLLVGEPARNQWIAFPERTIKSIKRRMGSRERILLGEKEFRPSEIAAVILRQLKMNAEDQLGQPLRKAVITVPAFFSNAQRQATFEAGELAGLEVVRMIHEPTAAALAYEAGHEGARKILVYDLGGGTFDVSVVDIQGDVIEVVSSHGNNRLGGDDFDRKIVEYLLRYLREQRSCDVRSDLKAMARLWRAAETAKHHLSDHPFAVIEEAYLGERDGQPINLRVELSRGQFDAMISEEVEETLAAVHTALSDAALKVTDIEEILLVGGATRTPLIQRRLEETFGMQPRAEVHPDLCVALGAAIQAGVLAGVDARAVLLDVTPYTFGTNAIQAETQNAEGGDVHYFAPIIRKNTPIPVTKSEVFCTVRDNQEEVEIKIYQGESPDVRENILIGDFTVTGLSQHPAGNLITVQLSLDCDGILEVTATEKGTGTQRTLLIKNTMSRYEPDELAAARERIEALFRSGGNSEEEASESREVTAEDVVLMARLEGLVTRAGSLFKRVSREDAEDLHALLAGIRDAREGAQNAQLEALADQLADLLYYLEA
ncbi:Hsp70 family protein [Sulfidibacter corallicola]|uniref:Hsp70 family protein n=1 Tax=Sulfidibacter corallicola TaxID=2818388 RepID=A0A8A4TTI8_SULCO|nr:Hsp70 family protein [Sulfidibacter corallicola]QTD52840.1 Hsp70 family protein [Sulfidibacter corallicola]